MMPAREHTHVCQNCGTKHGHNDKMHGKHHCPNCTRKCSC